MRPKTRGTRPRQPEKTHTSPQPPNTDSVQNEHFLHHRWYIKPQPERQRLPREPPSALVLHGHAREMLEGLTARWANNSLSVPPDASSLSPPSSSLQHVCKPNMELIWPTPAPNPIIKPACLNISHWHGPFQLL